MEMLDHTYILLLVVISVLGVIIFFFLGRNSGIRSEKASQLNYEKRLNNKIALIESGRDKLLREIENLKRTNEKYLYFVVRVPETVKHLNSSLSFDETVSSIIRFTKDIVNTDTVELYIYRNASNTLELEAAYGSNRKSKINVPYGEGIIGKAAELKTIITRESHSSLKKADDLIFTGAPVMFRNTLIGVIGIGNIKDATGDEKRMIAMVSDLAGVSLQNCATLSSAQQEANTDALTGLYNRRFFAERSLDEAQKAISYNFPISMFMFDIDNFKVYNDKNGHAEGDYLLRELSRLLKENTRGRDVIARYGGEEFIVMLPNTDKKGAGIYGEKIRGLIESAPFKHKEKQPLGFVSISGGIATFPADGDTIDTIIKLADSALYKSKESGRNKVTKFEHFKLT